MQGLWPNSIIKSIQYIMRIEILKVTGVRTFDLKVLCISSQNWFGAIQHNHNLSSNWIKVLKDNRIPRLNNSWQMSSNQGLHQVLSEKNSTLKMLHLISCKCAQNDRSKLTAAAWDNTTEQLSCRHRKQFIIESVHLTPQLSTFCSESQKTS